VVFYLTPSAVENPDGGYVESFLLRAVVFHSIVIANFVLFFFLFNKKKEETILSSAYQWQTFIKAKY
jgi:hypothetical protein